jgi:hypothetical protein
MATTDSSYQLRLLACAHPTLNSSNVNVSSYSADSPTLRRCKSNQTTSEFTVNPFFSLRFSIVKAHRATVTAKEREIPARELQNEQRLT